MRAINHALTGSIIGFVIGDPLAAVPASVLSHFAMDAIPHYDLPIASKPKLLRTKAFKYLLCADAVLCLVWVLILIITRPQHWLLACVCAFAAAAPDFLSFNRYISAIRRKKYEPGWYSKFASKIQWFERPIGGVVEVAWFAAAVVVLVPLLGQ